MFLSSVRRYSGILLVAAAIAGAAHAGDYRWTPVSVPISGATHLAIGDGSLYVGGNDGLWRSDSGGTTWTQITPNIVWRMDAEGSTVCWETNEPTGYFFYRSTAKGDSPTTPSVPWGDDRGDMLEMDGGYCFYGTTHGFYVSTDGGATWPGYAMLWDTEGDLRPQSAAAEGTTVMGGMRYADGTIATYGGICRSTASGAYDTFSNVLTNGYVHALAISGDLAVAQSGDGYHYSTDAGATWQRPADNPGLGLLWGDVSGFVIDGDAVIAASDEGGVSISLEKGGPPSSARGKDRIDTTGSWVTMNSGLPLNDLPVNGLVSKKSGDALTLYTLLESGALYTYTFPTGVPTGGWDLSPPTGNISVPTRAGTNRAINLSISGYDLPSGTGVGVTEMGVGEYLWTGTGGWVLQNPDTFYWRPFANTLAHTMSETAGDRIFVLFLADANGNISSDLIEDETTLWPEYLFMEQNHVFWTYVWGQTNQTFTVTVTPLTGDPDLYWWSPSNNGYSDGSSYNDGTVSDSVTITPTETGWHCLAVYAWGAGTYSLSYSLGGSGAAATPKGANRDGHATSIELNADYGPPDSAGAVIVIPDGRAAFGATQSCSVSSTGHFWAMVYNYATAAMPDSADAWNSATLEFPAERDQWIGAYIYDYDTAAYTQGFYLYRSGL